MIAGKFPQGLPVWEMATAGRLLQWTKSFENCFKCFAQLTLRLGFIRRLISLIRKLDRVGKLPRPNSDLHRGYHTCADFLGLNSYHVPTFLASTVIMRLLSSCQIGRAH